MIEINLLPDELRKVEGTPPARLLVILLSVVVACCLGVVIGNYYVVKIPRKNQDIALTDKDIKDLTEKKKAVDKDHLELTNLEQKVKALDNLSQARILYGRLLTKLWRAVPAENCWLRSFAVVSDDSGARNPAGGKRFKLTFNGTTTGPTELDRERKLSDFMLGLEHEFEVLKETEALPAGQPWPADLGFNKWNSARFSLPILIQKSSVELPALNLDPKLLSQITQFKTGLDFTMTMSFELPAPIN